MYLDFKKAFDCVDHDILLQKLHHYGIRGIANDFFRSYLSDRQQFTRLGKSDSSSRFISCGVPQGSNLGPLLFLIFINDLPHASRLFQCTLFADDSTLTAAFPKNTLDISTRLNTELELINSWLTANKIVINADKTKYISFSYSKAINLNLIKIGRAKIKEIDSIKFLGIYLDKSLNFKSHINYISKKLSKSIGILNKLKYYLPIRTMKTLYMTFIHPYVLYGIEAWFAAYKNVTNRVVSLQKRAIRIVKNAGYLEHTSSLFKELEILKAGDLFKMQIASYMYNTINNHHDENLLDNLTLQSERHAHFTRNSNLYVVPRMLKSKSMHSIEHLGVRIWNGLPLDIRNAASIKKFRTSLNLMMLRDY